MSADPMLLPTEEMEDLRAAVREVLADRCDPVAVTACYDGDRALVAPLWGTLSRDLGLAGLLVPEEYGGHGATAREAAVVLDELGASVAPVPFLTSAVLATSLLVAGGAPAGDLLGRLASGESTAVVVVPWTSSAGAVPTLRVDGGTVRSVAGALEADVLLLPVGGAAGGLEVRAVAASDAEVAPVVSLDMTRQLADVTVSAETLAAAPVVVADAAAALDDALIVSSALLASEQAGIARWCLTTTVAYLKERRQFGRPLGGFQALKHRLADLYVATEQASAAAAWAAATVADAVPGPSDADEVALAAAVASAYCAQVALTAAEETIQLHAGIAMTWEHPAHLALKRAKSDQLALGSPEHHQQTVARLADLPS